MLAAGARGAGARAGHRAPSLLAMVAAAAAAVVLTVVVLNGWMGARGGEHDEAPARDEGWAAETPSSGEEAEAASLAEDEEAEDARLPLFPGVRVGGGGEEWAVQRPQEAAGGAAADVRAADGRTEDDAQLLARMRRVRGRPLVPASHAALERRRRELRALHGAYDNAYRPLVHYYYPVSAFFGDHMLRAVDGCPAECRFSEDHRDLPAADAVVFHIPVYRTPEVPWDVRERRQITVALSMESAEHYPNLISIRPEVDLEMSYRLESDVWTPYFGHRIPFRQEPVAKNESALAAAFISNCASLNNREELLDAIMERIDVDSFGQCSHNTGARNGDKMQLLQHYKFYLAFENTCGRDYVTEKIYHALRVGSVPVYYGAENVEFFIPSPAAAILRDDFASAADLARYLELLAKNEAEYDAWLEWKQKPFSPAFEMLRNLTRVDARCRLCMRVHEMLRDRDL